jgi:phosphatidate phosphatase APP1
MEYEVAEGMRDRYLKILERHPQFDNIAFQYVSGSPWQMFRLLHEFLIEQVGFPSGVFHMKQVNFSYQHLNDSLRDLRDLLSGPKHTEKQKKEEISTLLHRFPERQFILIGDTGERDPEVYREMKNLFGPQVEKIYIRDVNELGEGASRLEGMRRIDLKGVCLQEQG